MPFYLPLYTIISTIIPLYLPLYTIISTYTYHSIPFYLPLSANVITFTCQQTSKSSWCPGDPTARAQPWSWQACLFQAAARGMPRLDGDKNGAPNINSTCLSTAIWSNTDKTLQWNPLVQPHSTSFNLNQKQLPQIRTESRHLFRAASTAAGLRPCITMEMSWRWSTWGTMI